MICPWCGKEMGEGRLRSTRTIILQKDQSDSWAPYWDENNVRISKHNWTFPRVEAFFCDSCRKVVIDEVDFGK